MTRRVAVAGALVALLYGAPARAQEPPCAGGVPVGPLGAALDARVAAAQARGFTGAVLVEQGGRIVLCRGYGPTDATGLHAITPRTRFFIASIAKQFTAAAILLLHEDGVLDPGDSLVAFFPDLEGSAAAVTLHRLLVHIAGLRENYRADGIAGRDSMIAAVFRDHQAGSEFNYTNDAYAVLAAVIEVVSDESFESFVERRLLAPAGIEETTFWSFGNERDASGYAQLQTPLDPTARLPSWGRRGSNGMWSSVVDLYRWVQAAWRGPLLSGASRTLLFEAHHTLPSGLGIGYGSFRSLDPRGKTELWARGTEGFGHSGVIRWYPDDDALVIVLSNGGQIEGRYANQWLSDQLLEVLHLEGFP